MSSDDLSGLREEVAAAARQIAADGLALGTAGNLSGRIGDRIAVTPTGARLAELEAREVTIVDRAGTVLDGPLAPTSELALHLGVYARYDAGAVVHTHAPVSTALACVLEDELPCIHYGMLALGGDIPVAAYRTFGSPDLAAVTVAALEGKAAALMANHGTIAHGADVAGAVANTRLLEWAAQLYVTASSIGTPRVMSAAERQDVVAAVLASGYGATRSAER